MFLVDTVTVRWLYSQSSIQYIQLEPVTVLSTETTEYSTVPCSCNMSVYSVKKRISYSLSSSVLRIISTFNIVSVFGDLIRRC